MKIEKITIIGGNGEMGRMFRRDFEDRGVAVRCTGRKDTPQARQDAIEWGDMIIVSAPIESTPAVIADLLPRLRPDQLLSDFTSVKANVVPVMKRARSAVISAHPLFGPLPSVQGQKMILLPLAEGGFLHPLQELYEAMGLKVVVLDDWRDHDRYMACIQSLTHFSHITFAATLRHVGADIDKLLSICSPVYQVYLAFACRIMGRNPDLYGHIMKDNPSSSQLLQDYIRAAQDNLDMLEQQPFEVFREAFLESRAYLADALQEMDAISEKVVNHLKDIDDQQ